MITRSRVLDVLAGWFWSGSLGRLVAAQYGFYARHQFLGIKWFDNIVVRTELQAEYFVKDFAFGREHDDRNGRLLADLTADLISVDAGEHQVKQDQIWRKKPELTQRLLAVVHDFVS